jgi:hypothetical protein
MPIGVRIRQYAYTHMGYVKDSYKVCLRSVGIDMAYMLQYRG